MAMALPAWPQAMTGDEALVSAMTDFYSQLNKPDAEAARNKGFRIGGPRTRDQDLPVS